MNYRELKNYTVIEYLHSIQAVNAKLYLENGRLVVFWLSGVKSILLAQIQITAWIANNQDLCLRCGKLRLCNDGNGRQYYARLERAG